MHLVLLVRFEPTNAPISAVMKVLLFQPLHLQYKFPLQTNFSFHPIGLDYRIQGNRAQNFVHHFTTNMFPVGRQSTNIDLDAFYKWAIFSRWPL